VGPLSSERRFVLTKVGAALRDRCCSVRRLTLATAVPRSAPTFSFVATALWLRTKSPAPPRILSCKPQQSKAAARSGLLSPRGPQSLACCRIPRDASGPTTRFAHSKSGGLNETPDGCFVVLIMLLQRAVTYLSPAAICPNSSESGGFPAISRWSRPPQAADTTGNQVQTHRTSQRVPAKDA
jgi:hypothetical protein